MAATDVRPKITLACVDCKNRNYIPPQTGATTPTGSS